MPKLAKKNTVIKSNQNVSRFLNAIDEFMQTESNAVKSEIIDINQQKKRKLEEEISHEIDEIIKHKLEVCKNDFFVKLAKKKASEKEKLYILKNQLLNDLSLKCENYLQNFSSNENYIKFLESSCENVKKYLNENQSITKLKYIISVKNEDLKHEDLFKKILDTENLKMIVVEDIKLGGFRITLENSNQIIDETLDEKFIAAKSKFTTKFACMLNKVGEKV